MAKQSPLAQTISRKSIRVQKLLGISRVSGDEVQPEIFLQFLDRILSKEQQIARSIKPAARRCLRLISLRVIESTDHEKGYMVSTDGLCVPASVGANELLQIFNKEGNLFVALNENERLMTYIQRKLQLKSLLFDFEAFERVSNPMPMMLEGVQRLQSAVNELSRYDIRGLTIRIGTTYGTRKDGAIVLPYNFDPGIASEALRQLQ